MELLQLEQGTPEWKLKRESHFTASDAPALMGASKYKTRKQLLDEKSGAPTEVITPAKQKLFDKGHEAEDSARSVLELETMDCYFPCVGVRYDVQSLPLMASFDGRSDYQDHDFEHKLWNETLAGNVRNNTLEASHYWQLEHQLLVSEDDYVLFVVSDGTAEKREMMKYYPVDGRKEELIAAWTLFQSDLEGHQVEAKQELVVAEKCSLPVIQCSVTGSQITTNISTCLVEVQKLAKSEMERSFETDQDFADKDQLNKDVKKARAELKERVASVKAEFVSYSEFESVASDMDKVLQQMQSHGEKQVKQAKENKKTFLKNEAHASLTIHITECNATIKAPFSIEQVITIAPDWLSAMKNKRTIKSIEDALDTELNNWKVQLTTATEVIAPNFKFLQENADEYKFLFQDVFTLINQPEESFQAIVTTRINEHKVIEEKRLADEKARIEKEAKEKAEAEAKKKIADEEERIRKEEREKLQAEQVEALKAKQAEINAQQAPAEKTLADCGVITQGNATTLHTESTIEVNQQEASKYLAFDGSQGRSQAMRNSEAIEAQSTHKPPHTDFLNWAREFSIGSDAFLALEILIKKHLTK